MELILFHHFTTLAQKTLHTRTTYKQMNALLIDDEQESHEVLTYLLKNQHPEINILGNAFSVEEGVRFIEKYQPDLLFLDIEMPDGTGFDLLRKVKRLNFQVVFITAYNNYAQTAIRFEALDYLVKPVNPNELKDALWRAKFKQLEVRVTHLENMQKNLINAQEKILPDEITILIKKEKYKLLTQNIIRLQADGNYTIFFVENEPKPSYLVTGLLKDFEKVLLPFQELMRIHKSHIIHFDKVVEIQRGEQFRITMIDGETIRVSRPYRKEFLRRYHKYH